MQMKGDIMSLRALKRGKMLSFRGRAFIINSDEAYSQHFRTGGAFGDCLAQPSHVTDGETEAWSVRREFAQGHTVSEGCRAPAPWGFSVASIMCGIRTSASLGNTAQPRWSGGQSGSPLPASPPSFLLKRWEWWWWWGFKLVPV